MTKNLQEHLDEVMKVIVTPEDKEEQRRSFALGNAHIENPRITREMIDQEVDALGLPISTASL